VGAVFIVFVGLTVKGLVGTLRNLFTTADNDSSVQARVDRIPKVLKLISEYPYFGRGFGRYNLENYFLLDNELQKTAIETGLVGVAVLVVFIGFVCVMAWRTRLGDESGTLPGTALTATILGLFISSYTFDAFFYRILTGVLYLSIGLVGALYRVTAPERERAEETWFETRLAEREVRHAAVAAAGRT
jgi:O-antigen ligase